MTQLKVWILLFGLCVMSPLTRAQEFKGKLIFSVEVLEWSMERNADGSKGPKKRTGIFYYYQEAESRGYPTITGYKLREGEIIGIADAGSPGTEAILQKIGAIPLSSFNVQQEIDATIAKGEAEARRTGKGFGRVIVTDGAKYRIRYDFNGVIVDHTDWNPGPIIGHYALYSENLRRLNELIDLFASHYGRRQFQL